MKVYRKHIIGLIALLFSLCAQAQDSLMVMHYNLLNYGNYTSYCTSSNNAMTTKVGHLATIIDYTLPDVFSVNELGNHSSYADHILQNALNIKGRTQYERAAFTNNSSSPIVNMLYYNSHKLQLHSQYVINDNLRDVNVYRLFHRSEDLNSGDTCFINCIVVHLKAGSSTSDKNQRAATAANIMNHLNLLNQPGNYLLLGDLNLKTSSEQAWTNLTLHSNTNIRFADPVNTNGNWNNNSSFADLHTQSTHSSSNGCASSGGMDDRFDFILCSPSVMQNTQDVVYVGGSYKAIGNDGQHFNQSINSGSNNSAPGSVISALYQFSDHLPISLKLKVDRNVGLMENAGYDWGIRLVNPVENDIRIHFANAIQHLSYHLTDINGREILNQQRTNITPGCWLNIPATELPAGVYVLQLQKPNGQQNSLKIIKR